jgi:hypothetical protein
VCKIAAFRQEGCFFFVAPAASEISQRRTPGKLFIKMLRSERALKRFTKGTFITFDTVPVQEINILFLKAALAVSLLLSHDVPAKEG